MPGRISNGIGIGTALASDNARGKRMITSLTNKPATTITTPNVRRHAHTGANAFIKQLSAQLTQPTSTGAPATSVAASTDITLTAPRQDSVTIAKSSTQPVPPAISTPPAPQSFSTTAHALDVLSQALQAAGIDPKSLNMVAHDDLAGYPGGGSWTNHLITLQAGRHTENFMADLMMINPNVAVTEIKHLLTLA